jgi:hypothetical protein
MAIVNMGRLDHAKIARAPTIEGNVTGRMILRSLMDGWKDFPLLLANWRAALRHGGLDSRGQDTFGTLLAVANLMLGDEAMEAAGLPITEENALGEKIARLTAFERADASDNWRLCFERMLGSTIEAWKSGEKPTVGHVIEKWESGEFSLSEANERLRLMDLALRAEDTQGRSMVSDDFKPGEAARKLLCVPLSGVGLERMYAGTQFSSGGWGGALKQASHDVVIRNRGNGQNVKINRITRRCLLVDLAAFDGFVKRENGDG